MPKPTIPTERDWRYPPRLTGPHPMPYTPAKFTDIRRTFRAAIAAGALAPYPQPLPAVFRSRNGKEAA